MNTEWVYVIELAPSGHVKVGRTSKLASRINAHVANAGFGGSSVARVFSVACTNAATVERALLDHLTARQGALLVHGKETFAGVPFFDAAQIAERIVKRLRGTEPPAGPMRRATGELVDDCREEMDAAGVTRLSLVDLCYRLAVRRPDRYAGTTPADLGRALRSFGIRPATVWCPLDKRTAHGVKLEWITARSAA